MCQLGGSDPTLLARAAQIVERYGYDEINLNCGAKPLKDEGRGMLGVGPGCCWLAWLPPLLPSCIGVFCCAL